jgi:hypothetical protein
LRQPVEGISLAADHSANGFIAMNMFCASEQLGLPHRRPHANVAAVVGVAADRTAAANAPRARRRTGGIS